MLLGAWAPLTPHVHSTARVCRPRLCLQGFVALQVLQGPTLHVATVEGQGKVLHGRDVTAVLAGCHRPTVTQTQEMTRMHIGRCGGRVEEHSQTWVVLLRGQRQGVLSIHRSTKGPGGPGTDASTDDIIHNIVSGQWC